MSKTSLITAKCQQRLGHLALPEGRITVEDLVYAIERYRNLPITLVPYWPDGRAIEPPSGSVQRRATDLVMQFDATDDSYQRVVTVLHELAHVLLHHDEEISQRENRAVIGVVLDRCFVGPFAEDGEQTHHDLEVEAEEMAYLLLRRSSALAGRIPPQGRLAASLLPQPSRRARLRLPAMFAR
jgi:hypothetical protein